MMQGTASMQLSSVCAPCKQQGKINSLPLLCESKRAFHSSMQCAAAMHPLLKELAVKVAKANKEKEHKPKFPLNGTWPEPLCNSLEPQIKPQQEQAQKLQPAAQQSTAEK